MLKYSFNITASALRRLSQIQFLFIIRYHIIQKKKIRKNSLHYFQFNTSYFRNYLKRFEQTSIR